MNDFKNKVIESLGVPENRFHPLVFILGSPEIGDGTSIGFMSEINANKSQVSIGKNCDIASFVSINCADSHKVTLGLENKIQRKEVILEDNVFVGSHSFIGGFTHIGEYSVVAAGTILVNGGRIPSYSKISGNPALVKEGFYKR